MSARVINEINEECFQNVLIKNKVLPQLNMQSSRMASLNAKSFYSDYDVSQLVLANQRLEFIDFISKFIR